ncbi:MAG: serine--tRNA ligase [Proteobacteria bacterium]|nr:serine--tRNA ligase [Pseudomonadota bacterium]
MLDIALVRKDPDAVRDSLRRRGADTGMVDRVLAVDERWRALTTEVEQLKARKNAVSESIPQRKKAGEDTAPVVLEMRQLGDRIKLLESDADAAAEERQALVEVIPNLPHESVPDGADDAANIEVRRGGEIRAYDFTPLPHWEVGERLGIIDFSRATKLTGSRFIVMKGLGARLERALISFFLDVHTRERGYTEFLTPFMVNRDSLFGTGQLPRFEEDLFKCQVDPPYYLIPTAEVPLTNLHRDEILEADALPLHYTAYSPCFRSEAGAAGRDTRGLVRVHQFDKVELVKFCKPEDSYDELETMVADAEQLLVRLEIPYRVVSVCLGDLGFTPSKKYDLEIWAPGQNRWIEISSCSNCTDFQARRANIKFRRQPKGKPEYLHTLNGSGLAVGRTIAALLENFQQADGSVTLPAALAPYMGVDRIPAGGVS